MLTNVMIKFAYFRDSRKTIRLIHTINTHEFAQWEVNTHSLFFKNF